MRNKIVVFFVIVALIAMIIIPLVGCTNGDDTETTTNPIVALQEDVGELNDNFNTEVANIKSRLSTLETSSIPANITNRVTTLEANVAALQVTVNALSAGDSVDLTALTEAVNDIADDVLAVNSSIDAIRGDVNTINLDITDLKNKYNSITIPDYDSRIQEVELRIVSILSSVETYGTDITAIKADIADIVDMIDDITKVGGYLDLMQAQINELENSLTNLSLNKAEITSFVASTDTNNAQLAIKTNKAGSYAIIITLYGNGLNAYDATPTPADISIWCDMALDISIKSYGSGSMLKIIIEPKDTVATVTTQNNWVAGKTVTLLFADSLTSESNIQYATIETAMR